MDVSRVCAFSAKRASLAAELRRVARRSRRLEARPGCLGKADRRALGLTADVRGFARSYQAPSFAREMKNLIKLRAFFDAKLPR